MRRLLVPAALLMAIGLAAGPAAAQNGAMWVDPFGRMMSMQFAGGGGMPPRPMDRTAAQMAALFETLCLETGGDPAQIAPAATSAGLDAAPFTVPAGKKAAPISMNVWTGPGLALSQTGGFFAAPNAQCNATFYVANLPAGPELTAALTEAIGLAPSNSAKATDKNGKPRKNFSPEWTVTGPAGAQIVTAMIGRDSQYMPGSRVQISVRAAKKAGK
jgi:hypothetical protein